MCERMRFYNSYFFNYVEAYRLYCIRSKEFMLFHNSGLAAAKRQARDWQLPTPSLAAAKPKPELLVGSCHIHLGWPKPSSREML